MSRVFQVPIPAGGQTPLVFPGRCISCGAPAVEESTLGMNHLRAQGGEQVEENVKYAVPHCARCARSTKATFLAAFIPFALGFIVVGGAAFLAGWLGSSALGIDEVGAPVNSNSLVIGGVAGLIGGMLGAFLFELVARLLLLPFMGRALWHAPLLAGQFLSNSDYVAGLTGKPNKDFTMLQLKFNNEAIAREFEQANIRVLAGRK